MEEYDQDNADQWRTGAGHDEGITDDDEFDNGPGFIMAAIKIKDEAICLIELDNRSTFIYKSCPRTMKYMFNKSTMASNLLGKWDAIFDSSNPLNKFHGTYLNFDICLGLN